MVREVWALWGVSGLVRTLRHWTRRYLDDPREEEDDRVDRALLLNSTQTDPEPGRLEPDSGERVEIVEVAKPFPVEAVYEKVVEAAVEVIKEVPVNCVVEKIVEARAASRRPWRRAAPRRCNPPSAGRQREASLR